MMYSSNVLHCDFIKLAVNAQYLSIVITILFLCWNKCISIFFVRFFLGCCFLLYSDYEGVGFVLNFIVISASLFICWMLIGTNVKRELLMYMIKFLFQMTSTFFLWQVKLRYELFGCIYGAQYVFLYNKGNDISEHQSVSWRRLYIPPTELFLPWFNSWT